MCVAALALLGAACSPAPVPSPPPPATPLSFTSDTEDESPPPDETPRPSRAPSPSPSPSTSSCQPTDQDQYVYNPSRLTVKAACIRVTGTVAAVRTEADGDFHILVALDTPYRNLLTPANQGIELGDLVIEPVCELGVSQTDAKALCAADHDPLAGPMPTIGAHVWMEGRYVLDQQHGGWAELHPLYRWGQ